MDARPQRAPVGAFAALVGLFLALQLVEVQRYRTINGDETYYMEAVWTMLRTGDWLLPRGVYGQLRFEKPILTYWAAGACAWTFGFALWTTRLHGVLLALATLPYVFGLGRITLGDRSRALLAAAVYLTLKGVVANANQGRTDTLLAFCVAASMYHFARALFEGDRPRLDPVLGHAFAAGAVLTKGLAGILFVYLPLGAFVLLARRRRGPGRARAAFSPLGLGAFLLVAAPWFTYVLATHGQEFIQVFTYDQIEANVGLERPFFVSSAWDYTVLLLRETFPWWPVLLLAFAADRAAVRRALLERRTPWWFHAAWLGLALLVLCLARTTRGRYLIPAFPVVALFAAAVLAESGPDGRLRRGLTVGVRALAVGAVLLAGVYALMLTGTLTMQDLPWLGVPVVALAVAGVALFVVVPRLDLPRAACALGGLSMALLSVGGWLFEPPAPLDTVAALGREVVAREPADERLATAGPNARHAATVLLFTTGRRATEVVDTKDAARIAERVRALAAEPGRTVLVLEDAIYSGLPEDLRARMQVVAERRAVLRHGLQEPPPPALRRVLKNAVARYDTVRVLALDGPPR